MTAKTFLWLSLTFGTLFCLLTPPFQSPDEYNHFFRAWQLSEGHFAPETLSGNRLGGTLPASLDSLKNSFFYLKNNYGARASPKALTASLALRTQPESRTFIDFPNTAIYAPAAYLPQALGIALGRLLTDRVLLIFYFARWFNLLSWTGLVFAALNTLPFLRRILFALALLPASLCISATLNADVLSNGLAFWLIARLCRDFYLKSNNGQAVSILTGVLLSMQKLVLMPFGLLFGLAGEGWKNSARRMAIPLIIFAIAALWWGQKANNRFIPYDRYSAEHREAQTLNPGVDPPAQMQFILEHPLGFAAVVGRSAASSLPSMAAHFVGKFGWEKNYLPAWLIGLLWLALLAVIGLEENPFDRSRRVLLLASGLAYLALWAVTMYALWCPVGGGRLDNWQGRYFFATGPLFAFAAASGLLQPWLRWLEYAVGGVLIAGNLAMVVSILGRYWW